MGDLVLTQSSEKATKEQQILPTRYDERPPGCQRRERSAVRPVEVEGRHAQSAGALVEPDRSRRAHYSPSKGHFGDAHALWHPRRAGGVDHVRVTPSVSSAGRRCFGGGGERHYLRLYPAVPADATHGELVVGPQVEKPSGVA